MAANDIDKSLSQAPKGIDAMMAEMADMEPDVEIDWLTTYVDGLELLGLKVEDRTEPWPGACNVYHPLMTEALVKFQAETMMETFPAAGPVKTVIIGKQTKEKEALLNVLKMI
jgi:hypothetical protein